ncbi:hypothetical protein AMR41_24195 [Hapalosiphon sp. MRB220]|nr:hypothetical protein AMR41_24195 [Hapalosiphon sp. MRB220]
MATEASELIDLVFTLQDRLQFLWNFYFVTVLGILGFIASLTSGIPSFHANYLPKFAITIIFVLFAIGNFHGLWLYGHLARDGVLSLSRLVEHQPSISESAQIVANKIKFRFVTPGVIVGHVFGDLIVLGAIWFYLNPKPVR